jgi:hypothetical protein
LLTPVSRHPSAHQNDFLAWAVRQHTLLDIFLEAGQFCSVPLLSSLFSYVLDKHELEIFDVVVS